MWVVFPLEIVYLKKGGDLILDLFDFLFLTIELISLVFQIKVHKNNSHTTDVVVIIIKKE